ncbi:hypothetical protein EMIHUDRAFT_448786 [Emiliania huxleyi CCMP1516]|uniref:Uncharacterized protein n=2 Tax=Emiliania huxleyi TaxID=2903 RepID=A0A0D3L064_EMIH1|nr:hypothetical protein EMIHUDRAFT_448786 [Emiliania huxleyi CCMP1516]EOD41399.1 hypothetical protein EMIHUDRAFT_448786 [Emiliania huxleyi CCMP1516]|eukprot:XP_005793828.1 hypothetical protein EMIHUDRAFT_448786 [Emiliania huxleyi CCMP1516]
MSMATACRLLGPSKYELGPAALGLPPPMPAARPDAYQLAARAGASAHGDAGASQRSAGSLSQCSSQDGAVLGRFPKPSAPFRTPAATPSLSDGGLVQSLLRQQAERDETMRQLEGKARNQHDVQICSSPQHTLPPSPGENAELKRGQQRHNEEMHALDAQRREELQTLEERLGARLKRTQEEVFGLFQRHRLVACSPPCSSPPTATAQPSPSVPLAALPLASRGALLWDPARNRGQRQAATHGAAAAAAAEAPMQRVALDPINASAAAHRQPFRAPSPSPSFAASSCGSLYNRPIAKEDLFDDAETPPGGEQGSGANSPATRVQPSASSPQPAIGGYGRPPTSRRRFHRLDSRPEEPWEREVYKRGEADRRLILRQMDPVLYADDNE